MAKILLCPDLHYGYDNYSVPGPDGVPSRVAEWRRCAEAIVQLVEQEQIDVVLMPGDAFTSGKHSPQAIIDVYKLYRQCHDADARVVGTLGNHDYVGADRLTPVDALAQLGEEEWGITSPQIVEAPCRFINPATFVQVAVLPWAKATALLQESDGAGDLNARASAALVDIVRGLAAQIDPNRPAILLGHWPVAGCVMSSGQILHGGEPALPLGELQAGPWDLVVMGHIHKRQQFPGYPPVLHAGAMVRRDFGEEHDDCGCYVYDTETAELTWYELPARKFFTWTLDEHDVADLADGMDPHQLALFDLETTHAHDAVCRVRYRATEEQNRAIDQQVLIQALYDAGAHHVAGVFPEIIRAERTRAHVTEETRPEEALGQWLGLKHDLSPDLKADVTAAAAELLKEVR